MAYEITPLLLKCNEADFALLISQIDSYVNFTSDGELKNLLKDYENNKSDASKLSLARAVEREIRYLGSSDVGYAFRKLTSSGEPSGVGFHEIIIRCE